MLTENIHDQLAVAVVGAAANVYITTLRNNSGCPITMFFLNATIVGTSIQMLIEESVDGQATWQTRYSSATITSAHLRRVFFSPYLGTSDSDTASVDANIYKPPLMAPDIRITVTTVGVTTSFNLDQFSNRAT